MRGTDGYGENAKTLAEQYESIKFSDVHRDVLHLFPDNPSRILDIGAGSGRDAAALSAKGHKVVAVEPTAELRGEGLRLHAGKAIEWVDDTLPDLSVVRNQGARYDVIMLTAVWMHLEEAERSIAMRHLANLMEREGRIIMSLRHGPVPARRKMFDVSTAETIALAAAVGLRCIHQNERDDMLGRSEVKWSFVCLEPNHS
ncbi:SAM-dependent methyltransferase [Phyllobacterium phragmitis]|uniref:SAM-dependent methyltransferase n=2 Tax=Phyllobacterium phragmitis TaxID=2670329 RepID=A0A2S9IY45_9HYPH|nr:SAM-dependent methyltransferase [Phyllobacterium phragmitis]